MYLSADFSGLSEHLAILMKEKELTALLTDKLTAESILRDDHTSSRLRELADNCCRLEHSIGDRILWIEDLISNFKMISYRNRVSVEEQLVLLEGLIE